MLLLLLLVSLFLLVMLGFYVFVASPRSRAHQTFAGFVLCLALWAVKDIVLWEFSPGDSDAGWWAGASFVLAFLLNGALAVFAWVFPENRPAPVKRLAVLLAPGAVFVPATIFGWVWRDARLTSGRFSI